MTSTLGSEARSSLGLAGSPEDVEMENMEEEFEGKRAKDQAKKEAKKEADANKKKEKKKKEKKKKEAMEDKEEEEGEEEEEEEEVRLHSKPRRPPSVLDVWGRLGTRNAPVVSRQA